MLHSLAGRGACFSWAVPISGAALAIIDSRFGTQTLPGAARDAHRMAPRISDFLGPVFTAAADGLH